MSRLGNTAKTFGMLSYGDATGALSTKGVYVFPPTYTLAFNTKPVMSDNGVTVKYNRNELTVTWILPFEYLEGRLNPQQGPDGNASPITVDTAVQQIRAILMQPAKELTCNYQGLGPAGLQEQKKYGFVINSKNDVNYGPLPLDFKWRSLAPQQCVEMTWTVAFHTLNQIIFDVGNSVSKDASEIVEISWSRSFDLDEFGNCTITTTGRYTLASYVDKHVDDFRFIAAFPVPLYCHRVSQRFQHDPTGKSTTFTIVDKQFHTENALPPKCIKMDLTHEVSSAIFGGRMEGKGFHQWNNVIQGSITLPPGEPFITAYLLFWFYARQRLFRTEFGGVAQDLSAPVESEKLNVGTSSNEEQTEKVRNIVTKVSYKESLFDRTHNFRLEYLGLYDRDKLIEQSGLFTPLYNYKTDVAGNYKYWFEADPDETDMEPWFTSFPRPTSPVNAYTDKASLGQQWARYAQYYNKFQIGNGEFPYYTNTPFSARSVFGWVGINDGDGPWVFYPDEQKNDKLRISRSAPAEVLGAWTYNENQNPVQEPTKVEFGKEKSYLAHENSFSIIEDMATFQIQRQRFDERINKMVRSNYGYNPPTKSTTTLALHNASNGSRYPSDTGGGYPDGSDYVSSYNSQPKTTILMSGYAVRAYYPPSIPSAFHYKGSSLVRANQSVVTVKQIARGKAPVYLATWSIPYYANTSVHTNFFADLESVAFSGVLT